MWLSLNPCKSVTCDTAHAQWPVGYNSIDYNGQIVNTITQKRIVHAQSWWRVGWRAVKFTTAVQGQRDSRIGHNVT